MPAEKEMVWFTMELYSLSCGCFALVVLRVKDEGQWGYVKEIYIMKGLQEAGDIR